MISLPMHIQHGRSRTLRALAVRRIAPAALFAVAFFACATSAGAAQLPQAGATPRGAPSASWIGDTSGPLVYLSDDLTDVVQVFSATTHREVGLIYGTVPAGLAVDGSGNIYIADTGALNGGQEILEFSPRGNKPVRVLGDFGFQPVGIALGPDGTLYAANDCVFRPVSGGCIQGGGNVVGYAPGATEPTVTLSVPGMHAPERVAVDAAGELVVSGLSGMICSSCRTGSAVIGEYDSTLSKFTKLNISSPLAPIHFDSQGRLALLRPETNTLDLFALPSINPVGHAKLGTPEPDVVEDFAFSSDGNSVWTAKQMTHPGFLHDQAMAFSYTGGQPSEAFLFPGFFTHWIVVSPGLQP